MANIMADIINKLFFGLKVTVIGMGVTFIGLITLIGLIQLNRFIAETINGMTKKAKNKQPKKPLEKDGGASASNPAPAKKVQPADNAGVVAAIGAAISVVMEGKPFKVTSIKKTQATQNTNAWDMVAIQEQNNNL